MFAAVPIQKHLLKDNSRRDLYMIKICYILYTTTFRNFEKGRISSNLMHTREKHIYAVKNKIKISFINFINHQGF